LSQKTPFLPIEYFSKNIVMIKILHNLALFRVKNANKNHNIGPRNVGSPSSQSFIFQRRHGQRGPAAAAVLREDELEEDAVADESARHAVQAAAKVRVKLVQRAVHADRDAATADLGVDCVKPFRPKFANFLKIKT
jgi:hypothetical protein